MYVDRLPSNLHCKVIKEIIIIDDNEYSINHYKQTYY